MKAVLTLLPDGRGILMVDEEMTQERTYYLRQAFDRWATSKKGVLILTGRVEHANSVELDLPVPGEKT